MRYVFICILGLLLINCSINTTVRSSKADSTEVETIEKQQFLRVKFNYAEMSEQETNGYDETMQETVDDALANIERFQSDIAVKIMSDAMSSYPPHPLIFNIYSWSLFRNGQRMKSIEVIDKGIKLFGPYINLVHPRFVMSSEMAKTGLHQKEVDGNVVFEMSSLPYDDDQFILENTRCALYDAQFLLDAFKGDVDYENAFIQVIASIYCDLEDYSKSNAYYFKLLSSLEYEESAIVDISRNFLLLKNYEKAEEYLLDGIAKYPESILLIENLKKLYKATGDKKKEEKYSKLDRFYRMIPEFLILDYDENLLETIDFFSSDQSPEEKMKKYEDVCRDSLESVINVSIIILFLHENHDNGLEEIVTEKLISIGNPAIPLVSELFQNQFISTCTVTKCAEIFSAIRDPHGWDLMVEFLPQLIYMPSTLIPPAIPANLVKFDEDKGARVLIETIKTFIEPEVQATSSESEKNSTSLRSFSFGQNRMFSALSEINTEKIVQIANECNYSDEELELLLKRVYD